MKREEKITIEMKDIEDLLVLVHIHCVLTPVTMKGNDSRAALPSLRLRNFHCKSILKE